MTLGVDLPTKQCGHTLSGSFKDLGMTVLISHVNRLRKKERHTRGRLCINRRLCSPCRLRAAAGIRTLVLLPRAVSAAQLVQPLARCKGARHRHGLRWLWQVCPEVCSQANVYLANSKNSLRIEGQKTVAFEICQGLRWQLPTGSLFPVVILAMYQPL